MSKTEQAIKWMESLANDNSHGYDQVYRWGEKGDYDCSSAVITAWETAGVPVKTKGATYTGNMRSVFLKCGFEDVTGLVNRSTGSGLQRGDILLNEVHHVAMYCGNGREVEASINEKGTARGGRPGDQTGREILIRSYRNYPWDCVLRYKEAAPEPAPAPAKHTFTVETVRRGSENASVHLLQNLLRGRDYYGADGRPLVLDGDFGGNTDHALRNFQQLYGLEVDGVAGGQTWKKILGV